MLSSASRGFDETVAKGEGRACRDTATSPLSPIAVAHLRTAPAGVFLDMFEILSSRSPSTSGCPSGHLTVMQLELMRAARSSQAEVVAFCLMLMSWGQISQLIS